MSRIKRKAQNQLKAAEIERGTLHVPAEEIKKLDGLLQAKAELEKQIKVGNAPNQMGSHVAHLENLIGCAQKKVGPDIFRQHLLMHLEQEGKIQPAAKQTSMELDNPSQIPTRSTSSSSSASAAPRSQ